MRRILGTTIHGIYVPSYVHAHMRLGSSPVRLVLHRLPILKTRDRLASPLARLLHARHRGTHCYIQRTHSYSCYNPLSIHTNTLYGASSRVTALLMPHCRVIRLSLACYWNQRTSCWRRCTMYVFYSGMSIGKSQAGTD